MSGERKFKASYFENIQELIASCIIWIKTDDYDAYCRFFDMGAMEELIKELNNLKEIEKSHKEENGKLRVELEQEKERNKLSDKEKEIIKSYRMLVEETGREDWLICNPKTMWSNYFVSKETIMREIKNIEKRMETATNSTEYQKLHCAQEYLRGLLWEV